MIPDKYFPASGLVCPIESCVKTLSNQSQFAKISIIKCI